jgi:hypothetical protein
MFNSSMFDTIKDALNNEGKPAQSSGVSDILRFEKNNTYTVRLLPNVDDPSKTFFHYFVHGWESFATGQYISFVSPQTFNERDPIAEYRYKVYKTGSQAEKDKARSIIRSEKWLVNVLVVDDPVNPDNNGKVKLMRFGKQLHKIIMDAITGEDSDQFGPKVFDLSPNGCNLRVRIDDQGGFPTYVASKFLMPSALDDVDPDSTYSEVRSLDDVFTIKSYEELQQGLNEHFHMIDGDTPATVESPAPAPAPAPVSSSTSSPAVSESSDDSDSDLDDDKIKMLLQGLDG